MEVEKVDEKLNLDQLVKNSNPDKTSIFQSRMIQELKKEFSNEEQEMFVMNFYMYITHHPTDDYPINLDDVWSWLGYSKKGHAKRLLMKIFKDGIDYKKMLPRSGKQVHGGHNEESIIMNVETFKKFCMKSNTKKADEIHDYYIKLETVYQKMIMQDLEQALVNNQLRIDDKERELEREKIKMDEEKKSNEDSLITSFHNRNVVYIVVIEENEESMTIKFGYSDDIADRMKTHRRKYKGCYLKGVFGVLRNRQFEQYILRLTGEWNVVYDKVPSGTEHLKLIKDERMYDELIKKIKLHIGKYNNDIDIFIQSLYKEIDGLKEDNARLNKQVDRLCCMEEYMFLKQRYQNEQTPQYSQVVPQYSETRESDIQDARVQDLIIEDTQDSVEIQQVQESDGIVVQESEIQDQESDGIVVQEREIQVQESDGRVVVQESEIQDQESDGIPVQESEIQVQESDGRVVQESEIQVQESDLIIEERVVPQYSILENVVEEVVEKEKVVREKKTTSKCVQKLDNATLDIITVYKSLKEAAAKNGATQSGIRHSFKNNTTFKKYRWRIVERKDDPNRKTEAETTVVKSTKRYSKIVKIGAETGELLDVFLTQQDAADAENVSKGTMYDNMNKVWRGSMWYFDDDLPEKYNNHKERIKEMIKEKQSGLQKYYKMKGDVVVKSYMTMDEITIQENMGVRLLKRILNTDTARQSYTYIDKEKYQEQTCLGGMPVPKPSCDILICE